MSRTSKALKRLGVAGVVAATIGAGVPAIVATSAQAAPGGATTQLSISPASQTGAAGTCLVYTVTPLNATGEVPADTTGQTIKVQATENPASDTQQIHFCNPTAPFATSPAPGGPNNSQTRLNETTDVGNTTTAQTTAVPAAAPNNSGAATFGVRGRVPGGANIRAFIDANNNNVIDAGEATSNTATATFNAGGTDNTSDTTAGGNAAQDAVKTITEIAQSATANPVAAGNTSASDQFITVQVKNASGDPVSGVTVSAQFQSGSANGAQTSPVATAQPITCSGGGTTTTIGTTTRTTNTAANNAAGGGSQNGGPVTNNAGIITCSYTAVRAGTDTVLLFVQQTTGGTSGPDASEPQLTVTRTTAGAPNTDVTKARNGDLTREGPIDTVSGQSRVFTATVTDAAGKRVQGVVVDFSKTGGGNLTSFQGSTNAFGQVATTLTTVAGETGQAVVTATIEDTSNVFLSGNGNTECDNAAGTPVGSAVYATALWSGSRNPAASSIASLSACSFACSSGSGNRSSRQMPASGITRSPTATVVRLAVTRSEGARSSSTAREASSGRSDPTRSLARSSTRASGRFTAPPRSGDVAGSAPRKHGVVATTVPSTTRLFSETWCPPNRHPHVPLSPGWPKTRR